MIQEWKARPAALMVGACVLGAALWLGGWAWALLMAVAIVVVKEDWRTVCPALFWLALGVAAGDRRLMFPFALHLAAGMGVRRGWWAGAGEMILFVLIRWAQGATGHVLGVETLATAPALALGIWAGRWGGWVGGLVAGVAGLVGLVL